MVSVWIVGTSRSGKTDRLIAAFRRWVSDKIPSPQSGTALSPAALALAANDDNRRAIADRLSQTIEGSYPAIAKTPLGFISDEVMLFWPLLFERLAVKAQFPLRLRPETEQELATQLWRATLQGENALPPGINEYRFVRQTLDLLQLAGAAGIPAEEIPEILEAGLMAAEWDASLTANPTAVGGEAIAGKLRGQLLLEWRQWCLERGLLSYGIIYELYWRYLLPDSTYQYHLRRRYQAVFADNVDDYPAIARDLIEVLLDGGATGIFTFNPDGKIRLGLNADPDYMAELAQRCQVQWMEDGEMGRGGDGERGRGGDGETGRWGDGETGRWGDGERGRGGDGENGGESPRLLRETVVAMLEEPAELEGLPETIRSIQTTSRAALLRQTADLIIQAIARGEVQPQDIAIIAPGLDAIARYTLIEIFSARDIAVEPLNEQRPLIASPAVRALLTLLALLYPGLGRLIDRDAVAEMLVVTSGSLLAPAEGETVSENAIDPARAGLIADFCYEFHLERPRLLPIETFPRWDRLGHRATLAYQKLCAWIEETHTLLEQTPNASVIAILDRAIKHFFANNQRLSFQRLSALRELMETAQHFWEVERRLRQNEPSARSRTEEIAQFIQLLDRGTISANARPGRPLGLTPPNAITLATIFQYRSSRLSHRWHFWLDASSHLWESGGAATLFAAPLFLRAGLVPWTPEAQIKADGERLERILRDLLARAEERVYLCHSDLAANGTEQTGLLLPLVYAAQTTAAIAIAQQS
ncbi:recombinase family protein [Oscillatoria sp. FACHB-1406]|uniref:recombinase family protein n=1 Tax=Oscillatoria sp. FACHB-1406 TaxID=2692846 RepID=UPI001687E6CA|nr:recombinase family protein [Oscillatoria sp. FACHB-1406]MBD2579155.1 recombinase family protein [Oscillatoria sp. FACHB-1406]